MNAGFDCIRIVFDKVSCSSQVAISHTFMEMILNLIYFTDFYFVEILTSLFRFFSTIISLPTLLLKTYAV